MPAPSTVPTDPPNPAAAPWRQRFAASALAAVLATTTGACSLRQSSDGLPDDLPPGDGAAEPAARNRGSGSNDTAVIHFDVNDAARPVVIQLDASAAPKTVANFKDKILSGYYEGTAVHRVIPRYVIQAGDPLSRSESNRSEWGTGGGDQTIPAEIGLPHERGSVAMARLTSGNPSKASSASQFYVTLAAQPELDGEYTVFGQVVQGMDVLDAISRNVVDTNDNPLRRIGITSTSLIPPGATIDDPGQNRGVGGRTNSIPDSRKSGFTRFIERIW